MSYKNELNEFKQKLNILERKDISNFFRKKIEYKLNYIEACAKVWEEYQESDFDNKGLYVKKEVSI